MQCSSPTNQSPPDPRRRNTARQVLRAAGWAMSLALVSLLLPLVATPTAASDLLGDVGEIDGLVDPITEALDPIAEPIVEPITEVLSSITEPIIEPIDEPILEATGPILAPLVDATGPLLEAASEAMSPVVATAEPLIEAMHTLTGSVGRVSGEVVRSAVSVTVPLTGAVVDPVFAATSQVVIDSSAVDALTGAITPAPRSLVHQVVASEFPHTASPLARQAVGAVEPSSAVTSDVSPAAATERAGDPDPLNTHVASMKC